MRPAKKILGAQEILDELRFQTDRPEALTPGNAARVVDGVPYFRPMDLGGTDASPHSRILRAMVRRGWVQRRNRGSAAWVYAITAEGRKALDEGRV